MGINSFLFPQQHDLENIKTFLAEIGGAAFYKPEIRHGDVWEAEIHSSSGSIFDKTTVARIDVCGGSVEGVSTDIILLQAFAWPANPHLPGVIIMASSSSTEGGDPIITFFTDLIMQSDTVRQKDKDVFTARLAEACQRHGQDIDECQALMAGRGMLGECAGECGMLYFFEQSDADLLADILLAPLKAYALIISTAAATPTPGDFTLMKNNRKKIIEWMLTQDYGVKVSLQNKIPIEVIEAYAFPPIS
jgi:hypothetical protein